MHILNKQVEANFIANMEAHLAGTKFVNNNHGVLYFKSTRPPMRYTGIDVLKSNLAINQDVAVLIEYPSDQKDEKIIFHGSSAVAEALQHHYGGVIGSSCYWAVWEVMDVEDVQKSIPEWLR